MVHTLKSAKLCSYPFIQKPKACNLSLCRESWLLIVVPDMTTSERFSCFSQHSNLDLCQNRISLLVSMYKNISVKGLSVKTAAENGDFLFQNLCLFVCI